uniref:Apple domain-containing protein n=1 Tax=Xiphophorus couchianus TaxID=32473 RepID=A0A3B5KQW4_9TELE
APFYHVLLLFSKYLSHTCIQGFLQNVDFPGSDVVDLYSPSVEHCQELCTQHPSCLFFSFNRRFRCYLKSSSSGHPQSQVLLLGVSSGYSLKACAPCFPQVFEDADFHGGDYRTLFTVNFEECQRVCTLDPVCQFFTFVMGNFSSPDVRYKCHLKFSWYVPRPVAVVLKAGVISGFSQKSQLTQHFATVCRSHLFSNTDLRGNDFLESQAVSPEHCQFLCSVHPQCTYFSFSSNDFRCFLKNNPNSMVARTKSWAKLTYKDIEFRGSDFRSEVVTCVDICQEKCTEDPNCQFYTYHNGSFFHPDHRHRCYMKRVITMPTPSQVKKVDNVKSGFTLRNCRSA